MSKPHPDSTRLPQISDKLSLGKASLLLALMIGISRITGFGRMVVTSHLYGQNDVTDAYNAAFNIPDTISIIIAGGALATGFVPVFTEYLAQGRGEAAQRTFRAMFTLLMVVFGALTIALIAATYTPLAPLLAPRNASAENLALYNHLLRILLVSQFVFVIGGMFTGTLNSLRLFWYPALQPVFFNCGIIIFGLAGPKFFGAGIESQAWGALFGAVAGSVLIQIPALNRNHLSLRPLWDVNDPGVRRVMKSLLPIVFGLASGQIIAMNLPRFFAAGLGEGAITALDNANRLMQVPIDILASGPAIALYPTMALLCAQGRFDQMCYQLASTLRRVLVMTLLATALIMALRVPLIQMMLQHGKFTKADTDFTAGILYCYCFGLVGLGAQRLLARGFYALGETRAPVVIGMAAVLCFCALATLIVKTSQHDQAAREQAAFLLALDAAFSITLMAVWTGISLRNKLGGWDQGLTLTTIRNATVCASAGYVAAFYTSKIAAGWIAANLATSPDGVKILARAVQFGLGCSTGCAAFLVLAAILKIQEVEWITGKIPGLKTKSKYFGKASLNRPKFEG